MSETQRRTHEDRSARDSREEALRTRTLARLIGMEPGSDETAQRRIVSRLEKALRGERRRGLAGHWTYDMNRHIALMQAHRAERARLPHANRRIPGAGAGAHPPRSEG